MGILVSIIAGIIGYLFGSLSFARIVTNRFAPGTDISKTSLPISNTDMTFESSMISASAVRVNVGVRYGCLTAILDMLKVALPTLAFKLWQPETPYFLIVAASGVIGHNWPLYHRFKGGRGESPFIGGLLVIDPIGLIVTNLAGSLVGWLAGSVLLLRWTFLLLIIPWFWLTTHDLAYILYGLVANLSYWGSLTPELKQLIFIQKRGGLSTEEEVAGDLAMGRKMGRSLDQYGAPALVRKLALKVKR